LFLHRAICVQPCRKLLELCQMHVAAKLEAHAANHIVNSSGKYHPPRMET
jgi:hypothetical protein